MNDREKIQTHEYLTPFYFFSLYHEPQKLILFSQMKKMHYFSALKKKAYRE